MPGLVVTIDVDHTKPMVVKDHQNNTARMVPVTNPNNPLQTLTGKTIVAMQTVTIIWSKSSGETVCYVIGGNMHCFP